MEREAQRNIELMWLTGRLAPDFKTIANFRKDNGEAIRLVCREFVMLCRKLELFKDAFVAIDGSKFKAVNTRDRNFTRGKMKRRLQQIDASIERYLGQIASADRRETSAASHKVERLEDKIAALQEEMDRLKKLEVSNHGTDKHQLHNMAIQAKEAIGTDHLRAEEAGQMIDKYWTSSCTDCSVKAHCTTSKYRRVARWEHEEVIEELETRMDHDPERMRARRTTVEHPFGTLKMWMGYTHFQMKTLPRVSTEMSLHVLAYNIKRLINLFGVQGLVTRMQTA